MQSMAMYKPPLSRARKIHLDSNETDLPLSDGNIAAVDFGTTSVSLAYTSKRDKKISSFILDTKSRSNRAPNAVLLKREAGKVRVSAFGAIAWEKFAAIRSSGYENHIYFERIKMLLKRENNVSRQTKVSSFSNEEFYLVEVIAFILQHLKDKLIDHLSRTVTPLKTTDFDWVITVPAIWDARGKRMMREAAYLAGLLTESGGITQFSQISDKNPLSISEDNNPDKLLLALEPESAAIYSHEAIAEQVKASPSAAISCPTEYMVIDIGGGTVDITTHLEVDGGIIVQNTPTGNAWGGTKVNEEFSKMLQNFVNDPDFTSFLSSSAQSSKAQVQLHTIIYQKFENAKQIFGEATASDDKEIAITLPKDFVDFYSFAEKVLNRPGLEFVADDDILYIDEEVVKSQLFGPVLDGIMECILAAITENKYKVNTFYLVGGFGGCKYIYENVSTIIKEAYNTKELKADIVVPPSPQLAVATGAVMWRKNPGRIIARRADATYGIGVSVSYDPYVHNESYKFYDRYRQQYRCNNVFDVFLEKGEVAKVNEVIITEMTPSDQSIKQMSLSIYSAPSLGVQYTKDCMVTKIGQLLLDVSNPKNLRREERRVCIKMAFSGTEIRAIANYYENGEKVATICDFLCNQ